jgi:DNA-binding NtrC family response regulator
LEASRTLASDHALLARQEQISMRCIILDHRGDFAPILIDKLGPGFALAGTSARDNPKDCDVIMVAVPAAGDPAFAGQLAALTKAALNSGGAPVVALVPASDRTVGLRALVAGAYDCFVETDTLEELRIILRRAARFYDLCREVERLRSVASGATEFEGVITSSERMRSLCRLLSKVAPTASTVLLTGESGTGKGLLAHAMHQASPRRAQPFVALSCASLPEHLIEAELFGHEKGAFTGALTARQGRFEAAGKGTIFLDEIGDLSGSMQVKLLRVLQDRTFERLGSNESRTMEARVLCATHRPLKSLIKTGAFRADLYYRISTVEVEIPSLQERRGDILLLAHSLLRKYAAQHSRPVLRFSPGVMAALQEHPWPGNVRELQNVVERAVVVCEGPEIHIGDLPPEFTEAAIEGAPKSFEDEVRDFKRRLIQRALAQTGHCKVEAAKQLGIARSSLFRLIEELQISASQPTLSQDAEMPELSEFSSNFGTA